jgi:hypothetical protein
MTEQHHLDFQEALQCLSRSQKIEWPAPGADIPHGDMPGDRIEINGSHIRKAQAILPVLLPLLNEALESSPVSRAVIGVCGGSGVGKSETASLLAYYLGVLGIHAYILSGDNYPHRYPEHNDAERLSVYREGAVKGLLHSGLAEEDTYQTLMQMQKDGIDCDPAQAENKPWLLAYQQKGTEALENYLGSEAEQDFRLLDEILAQFRSGADSIWLKRMGRTQSDLWFEKVDFSAVNVLIIEWTHASSSSYSGPDIPVLLYSTPAETAEHRRQRSRDKGTDSPFTSLVLSLEQQELDLDARKAKIIISKSGSILSFKDYMKIISEENA